MLATWHRQFIKQLFHYDRRRLDIERAFALKHRHLPRTLYKFRSFTESHMDALERGVLYRSPPDAFNDPFDTAAFIKSDLANQRMTVEDFEQISGRTGDANTQSFFAELAEGRSFEVAARNFLEDNSQLPPEQTEVFMQFLHAAMQGYDNERLENLNAQIRSGASVLSLSEALTSILMWSHYAANHSGFAISYNIRALPPLHPFCRTCFPVLYTKKPRNMSRFVFGNALNNLWPTFASMMKFESWSYEKEWRVVLPLGPGLAQGEISTPPIAHIYLGANVRESDKDYMRQFCEERSVPLSQMELKRATGLLDVRPILE